MLLTGGIVCMPFENSGVPNGDACVDEALECTALVELLAKLGLPVNRCATLLLCGEPSGDGWDDVGKETAR